MSLKRSCAGTECLNSLMSGIELGSITVVVCLTAIGLEPGRRLTDKTYV